MTALIFSYFLPDPLSRRARQTFRVRFISPPQIVIHNSRSRLNTPTRPLLEKCIYSLSSRYRKKGKALRFSRHCFWFAVCVHWPFSAVPLLQCQCAVIPLTETPVTPGSTGRLSLWLQSPSESCQVMSVSRLNLTLTAPSGKAKLVPSCK